MDVYTDRRYGARMRKILLAALLVAAALPACSKADSGSSTQAAPAAPAAQPPSSSVATYSVDEVDSHLTQGDLQAVDANGDSTRKKLGVVPGAILLTDSDAFQLTELPTDKTKSLVFYCANTACGASHHAAEKAIAAGYSHVRVMPDGIAGWVKAGKKTQQI